MTSKDLQDIDHLIDCAQVSLVEAKAALRRGECVDHELRIATGCCSTAFGIADVAAKNRPEAGEVAGE